MRDVEAYIERIMEVADLASRDDRRVRAELSDHLQEIVEAGRQGSLSDEEIMAMVTEQFGDAEVLGRSIARAKGRFRTYLKKEVRRAPIFLAAVLVLAFGLRAVAIQMFYAETDVLSPAVPKGDRVLVNKLASEYQENDIVVYREDDGARLGLVKRFSSGDDSVLIGRRGEDDKEIARSQIVGRAILQLR